MQIDELVESGTSGCRVEGRSEKGGLVESLLEQHKSPPYNCPSPKNRQRTEGLFSKENSWSGEREHMGGWG